MSHSLCQRCEHYSACLLNYDGKPCRKLRSEEPTNADIVRDSDNQELARFMASVGVKGVMSYINSGKPKIGPDMWDDLLDAYTKISLEWLEEVYDEKSGSD